MQGLLTALQRGFNKWIGWKRLGVAASLLIIALAVRTLVHTLKGVDKSVILTALTDMQPGHIALAALCVVCAFCTLTFYDFFAVRTIGKKGDGTQFMSFERTALIAKRGHGIED